MAYLRRFKAKCYISWNGKKAKLVSEIGEKKAFY